MGREGEGTTSSEGEGERWGEEGEKTEKGES